jgi:DNA-binding NarL/FixJ family response regulator
MGPGPLRALIVEDDLEFRLYLSDVLARLAVPWRVECVTLGQEAIAFARSLEGELDLALVDLGLPDMDGLQVVSWLRRHYPETPIVILSVIATEEKVMAALRCGANGYLLKDDDVMDVAGAVEQVLQGHHPISPQLAGYLIRAIGRQGASPVVSVELSERESQLLQQIAAGLSYAEAAHAMGVKISTMHSYSKSLFRKLDVTSKTQAALYARRQGLAAP